jgi:hypothetical protein
MEPLTEILKNYQEYIASFFVTVLSIFGFFIVRKYFTKKSKFNYYETNRINLAEFQRDGYKLDLFYKGIAIENPKIISWKFTNTGDLSIENSDWESPLEIVFSDAKILNTFISEKRKNNILCTTQSNDNVLLIDFGLLNKHDFLIIEVLLDSKNIEYKVNCRIKNIEDIENKEYYINPFGIIKSGLAIIFAFGIGIGFAKLILLLPYWIVILLLIILVLILFWIFSLFISKQKI